MQTPCRHHAGQHSHDYHSHDYHSRSTTVALPFPLPPLFTLPSHAGLPHCTLWSDPWLYSLSACLPRAVPPCLTWRGAGQPPTARSRRGWSQVQRCRLPTNQPLQQGPSAKLTTPGCHIGGCGKWCGTGMKHSGCGEGRLKWCIGWVCHWALLISGCGLVCLPRPSVRPCYWWGIVQLPLLYFLPPFVLTWLVHTHL